VSSSNPAAGLNGQVPVTEAKGWPPSESQKPWQDRRMLMPRKRPASGHLALGFCFLGRSFLS
jgi:hypothetical protein